MIFATKPFEIHDGDGIRTTVFFKGCPLRCKWCHNPEGLSAYKQIMYNKDRCMGCGACAEVCACHKIENGVHTYDRENCIACGKCTRECYSLALTQVGQTLTVEEVMQTVLLDQGSYTASGGGLTLSGGEPLMHGEFSVALLQKAKEKHIHTCVETSGFGNPKVLAQMAEYTDLFLLDYKVTGDEAHKTLCGVPQRPILENLAMLNDLGAKVILRCPLIPDLNGNEEHLQGIAATANKFSCILEVQLEPYHRLGISKSGQLGLTPDYESQPPETEWTEDFAERLRALCNKKVVIN